MKIEAAEIGARQWPILFIPPLIDAHGEDAHRRFRVEAVARALEPVVKPAQLHAVQIQGNRTRRQTKIDAANEVRERHRMTPRPEHEARSASGAITAAAGTHAGIVSNGAALKDVVPPADIERGHGDFVVLLLDANRFPVFVVARMVEPIEKVWRTFAEHREVTQRQMPHGVAHAIDRSDGLA